MYRLNFSSTAELVTGLVLAAAIVIALADLVV